jgi:hypothetical protein
LILLDSTILSGVSLGHHPHERVDGFFDALVKDLLPVDRKVAARAATLRGKRLSLGMPDALILATADLHEDIDTVVCAAIRGCGSTRTSDHAPSRMLPA